MEPEVVPRSRRARPAKAPLSADAIVDAGLAIVRAEGLEAATMRRIAAELDTGAASLYVYVRGSDELHDAMLARASQAIALESPDPGRWRAQVHALLQGVVDVLEAHPGLARVAVGNPPTDARTMAFAENLFGLLLAGRVAVRDAAWACDILPLLATSVALETDAYRARGLQEGDEAEQVARMASAFAALPADRFPLVTAHVAELIAGDGDARFHWTIDVMLDGLLARA